MRELIDRYFSHDIPVEERMFYLSSFLASFASLLFVLVGMLLNVQSVIIIQCSFALAFCTILFFTERKHHKTRLLTLLLIVITDMVAFPFVLISSDKISMEIPVYFLIGLTFCLVLLKGVLRVVIFSIVFIEDCLTIWYCFYYRLPSSNAMDLTVTDYFRIELSVLLTGILCGALIYYRNKLTNEEIEERELASKKAEEVSYAKDMFLVNVSHEIRTPLNAIIGTTGLLLESDVSNHIKEMAFNISNSSHALLSITSDLLDFSRMNIDALLPSEEKYDIASMMNDVINLMSVRLLDSTVDFYVEINPFLPRYLIGDAGKIRQIFVNMLSNAIKYTKEGHMTFIANFEYESTDKINLHITVEDTGIGIRKENLEKIFVPYNRSGEMTDHAIEGNGLGLSLCRKFAEAMGGRIWVESEYGVGSKFHFDVTQGLENPYVGGNCGSDVPDDVSVCLLTNGHVELDKLLNIVETMEITHVDCTSDMSFLANCQMGNHDYYMLDVDDYTRLKQSIGETGIDWKKIVVVSDCTYSYSGEPFEYVLTKPISCLNLSDLLTKTSSYSIRKHSYEGDFTIPDATVLVVDDNLVNLEVAQSVISRFGCRVITAASGKEGLITLEQEHVDIIFLDYMMPDMDGIDTLRAIRALPDESIASLPVITLTANVVSGAKEMFLNAGFDGYLSKPLEVEKLSKMLIEFLPSDLLKFDL